MRTSNNYSTIEELRFLTHDQIKNIIQSFGSPVFAYSEEKLVDAAKEAIAFPSPFGLTVRYAMKANPLAAILKTFDSLGIHIDASSGFEAERAIYAGIEPSHIMITSQQIPMNLSELMTMGVKFNATSLHQLEMFAKQKNKAPLSIRINAGMGSGYRPGVSVAGPGASFGIWHEHMDQVKNIATKYNLTIDTIHSHIGCGNDPIIWQKVARMTLEIVEQFPDVRNLNLGGGFKVARMKDEPSTDLQVLGKSLGKILVEFADKTGRELHLEIEPGTFLSANTGSLIAAVQDMTDTGEQGYSFLKLDTGMNDFMRPALHASQHPIILLGDDADKRKKYVVVGHNCESSDLLTPSPQDSELPNPRLLPEAKIGDLVVIEGVGAYCSSMRLIGYNSFPTPNEVMVMQSGEIRLVNKQAGVKDFIALETS